MFCRRLAHFLLAILVIVPTAAAQDGHLWVGPNVNMVSGTEFPTGDPFQQRQNEPSAAVSTRNIMNMMGFANDYRAVDIPFFIDEKTTGDAWLGVFKSFDGGLTWQSTLLRGYPQDLSEEGLGSPLSGYQAGADPVVRAGTHGLFYLSGIVFDRGDPAKSAVFVTRYMDLNNREGGDPIEYIDTTRVAWNDLGDYFIDKPWMAVDIPRNDDEYTLLVPQDGEDVSQTITCGNVYLAWAEITGAAPNYRSNIMFTKSVDCGENWDTPIQLSDPDTMNQGVTIAVSPVDGDVWVAWRQFNTTPPCTAAVGYWMNHPEEWALKRITLGKRKYRKKEALNILHTSPEGDATYILARHLIAAKLNVASGVTGDSLEDTINAADDWLMDHPLSSDPDDPERQEGIDLKDLLIAHNQGLMDGCIGTGGAEDAIMVVRSENGGESFTLPIEVSTLDQYGQGTTEISFRTNSYPTMTVDAVGRAYLAWATRGVAIPRADAVEGDARIVVSTSTNGTDWTNPSPIDQPEVEGHQIEPSMAFAGGKIVLAYYDLRRDLSGVFERFIADWPGLPTYRHTVDVRAAHAEPAEIPIFTDYTSVTPQPSDQLSRYAFTTNEPANPGLPEPLHLEQLQFNPPNLPIFVGGTKPFFGDYIDIATSPPFLPDGDDGWRYNTLPEDGAVFHAVWTDNRDVEAPHDGDWTNYVPPQHENSGGQSQIDPGQIVPDCQAIPAGDGQTRIRDQNTYTARISDGLYVAVPGGSRPLGDLKRAFVVFVRNDSFEDKSFRLSIATPLPEGVQVSFDQFYPVPSLDVDVARYSSFARTVFITSADPQATVSVNVVEVTGAGGGIVSGGLSSSVLINGDPTSPEPADEQLLNAEDYNLAMMNRSVVNLAMMNLAMMNDPTLLAMMNLAMMNPALVSANLINLAMMNLAMMNLAMMNPDVESLAMMNPSVQSLAMMNPAIFTLAMMNASMMNPAETNLAMMNLAMMNPDLANLAMMNVAMEVSEATWKVENTGSAAASYAFNMLADNVPSNEDLAFQLFVYKLYATPVADGCELKQELQHQMLVTTQDPEFLSSGEIEKFLDPEAENSAQNNVTFYLEPGEEVFVTLWIIDVDPEDDVEFSEEEVSAATVAGPVNTVEAAGGPGQQQPFDSDIGDESTIDELIITSPANLTDADQAVSYFFEFLATGGEDALTWSINPGSLPPPGLTLSEDGVLSGTPTTDGLFTFTVRVTDSLTQMVYQEATLFVNPGSVTFLNPPTDIPVGGLWSPSLQILVEDANGSSLPGYIVTLQLEPNEAGASVHDPFGAITLNDGVATMDWVYLDRVGTGYKIVATANSGDITLTSNPSPPFDVMDLVVVNTNDDGPGSLRHAIHNANRNSNWHDIISFNISGGGSQTIPMATQLPNVQYPVTIDGTTQPGYPGTPLIRLDGLGTSQHTIGLHFLHNSDNSLVRGLAVTRFPGPGIVVWTDGTQVVNNYVGTDGTNDLGNAGAGILIAGTGNRVGGPTPEEANVIAYNGVGIEVTGGAVNGFLHNSIFANIGLGIDLGGDGVTHNDLGDGDIGPNGLLNFPELTSAVDDGLNTTVSGSIDVGSPAFPARLEFYANSDCDPSGYGEGETYIGRELVEILPGGTANFEISLPITGLVGSYLTATNRTGPSSEFSACVEVTSAPHPSAGFALVFDGTDDFVNIPDAPSLSLENFTIEGWVRVDDPPGASQLPLMSKGDNYGNYTSEIFMDGGQATASYVHQTSGGNYSCCASHLTEVNLGEWIHVAWTWAGSSQTLKLFINGSDVLPAVEKVTPPELNNGNLFLGRSPFPSSADHYLKGQLDEMRIWNVVRTPAEILANYAQIIDPSTPGLVGYWNFNETLTDQSVLDLSPAGNDGSLGADSGIATDDPHRVPSGVPIQ
jgi:hypothetical protein